MLQSGIRPDEFTLTGHQLDFSFFLCTGVKHVGETDPRESAIVFE